jgi:hypothetical protein
MKPRERLMATLNGVAVDRPAVSFYEINGLDELGDASDPYNIYSHPSWRPLIDLARDRSDRIVMRSVPFIGKPADPIEEFRQVETWTRDGSLYTRTRLKSGQRVLSETTRRDPDVNTIWVIEHLLKDLDDLKAYLDLPHAAFGGQPDIRRVLDAEEALGESGIVMIDTSDPLCEAAALFDLSVFTILATTEPTWFRRLLDRFAEIMLPQTIAVSEALPGRLWRIYGPEYASPPYLHPSSFHEYVVGYDEPMVRAIQSKGGFARLHCHGRLRRILDEIAATGCSGLDPIEPPPQGDIELEEVRRRVGEQMVLFGNLEASDLENLPVEQFSVKIRQALVQGTSGQGRGFVLMASSCPYGRVLSERALCNYERMVEMAENFR